MNKSEKKNINVFPSQKKRAVKKDKRNRKNLIVPKLYI